MENKYYAHYRKDDNSFQTLEDHLIGTAEKCSEYCGKIKMPFLGELLGLLHDIGKYSGDFQNYFLSGIGRIMPDMDDFVNANALRGKIDHATSGGQFIWENFCDNSMQKMISQLISICLVSHHGGLIDCLDVNGEDCFTKRISKDKKKTFIDEVIPKIDKTILERIKFIIKSGELEKEVNNQFKLVSLKHMPSKLNRFHAGLLIRFLFSCLIDADRTDTANFSDPSRQKYFSDYPKWENLIEKFNLYVNGFKGWNEIDRIRSHISESCLQAASNQKGAFLLTLPTGSGKTLASLRFALNHAKKHDMDRIIYVIPYTTIIDQNAKIAREIFRAIKNKQVVLEHHSNLLPKVDNEQNQILSENWDAPIVFTTMVQFLNTLLADGTRDTRRMHQLANSIIIFDEIQRIPIKTVHLFNNAMNFLSNVAGTTAVYCTATQPLLNDVDVTKGALELSKAESIVELDEKMQDVFVRSKILDYCKVGGWDNDEIVDAIISNSEKYGSVLLIVNTKTVAKAIYQICKKMGLSNLFHLSTSMCPAHREKILKEINTLLSDSSKSVICISTQLVEAGIDIDFGCVMRSLAGFDSIVQAAGRCNRHGLRIHSAIFVFYSNQENLQKLPEIRIAQESSKRILREIKKSKDTDEIIINTAVMNQFYKYYFYNRRHEMSYLLDANEIGRDDDLLNLLSENQGSVNEYKRNQRQEPSIDFRQSFKTAGKLFETIDAPTTSVIVPYGRAGQYIISKLCSSKDPYELKKLLKRAQRYSVNLFPYVRMKLCEGNYINKTKDEILWLSPECYSNEFGVNDEPVADMPFLYC